MNTVGAGSIWGRRCSDRMTSAWLTAAVGIGTLAVSVAAVASSTLMQLMTRDLSQLRAGQSWRLVTPVLVQPDGWGQLVFNLLGITVIGVALERRTNRRAWTVIYLLGGIGGIITASAWHPADRSGGSSDAVAALVGALCVLLVTEDRDRLGPWSDWPARLYSLFFAGYLTALDLGGVWWSVLAGNATIIAGAAAASVILLRRKMSTR